MGNSVHDERLLRGELREEDRELDLTLRPRKLVDYVGQKRVVENLSVFIEAARRRKEALDHVLLHGPPGLGKTTLAHIVAAEMGTAIRVSSGPAVERPGDLAAILTNLEAGDVLFIDEIHRLPVVVEETLYPAMEDFRLDIVVGQGPGARSIRLELPPFTLIGATTRAGLLTGPLRGRFGIVHHLDYYGVEELQRIAERSASILEVAVEPEGTQEIAHRSRGTPRVANRLLRRVRDFAEVRADGIITGEVACRSLETLEVDGQGLDPTDRQLLITVIDKFGGGPVGLSTLAAAVGEERDNLEEIIEPYLIQIGFLERTPRGRRATPHAYRHLGRRLSAQADPQTRLF